MDKRQDKKKTGRVGNLIMNKRLLIIVFLIFAAFAAVGVKLFYILIVNGDRYSQKALAQTESETTRVSAKRGDIIDRNNVQLATSNLSYNLILDPKVILTDPDKYLTETVDLIEKYFDISAEELTDTINDRSESHYVVLKKNLAYRDVEEFIAERDENASVAGVWLEESYQRNYNFSTLASSVIGFSSASSGGLYGIEYEYDDELTGSDGYDYTYVNGRNEVVTEHEEAQNGNTVMLTIDCNMQSIVESKIAEFKEDTESGTVAVILQNPNTGEIYAMADSNSFDCNDPYDLSAYYTDEELSQMSDDDVANARTEMWKNFCITESYEPGSTFKPFTLAACLEENVISMDDTFYCPGYKEFTDDTVQCHNTSGHGTLTTRQAIAESCNVALMNMAELLGKENFCKYQSKFGYGQYTGIDLPNEMSCQYLLYSAENMIDIDLGTNSFGQNFNLTMIQLSSAFCSLINGGYYYRPYVVKSIYSDDGELLSSNTKTLVSRPISNEISDEVKECLRLVVSEGTGDYAQIPGYVISGKTGTAEKAGREVGNYLVSFIGFAPYDDPEIVCYVVIDEPENGDEHGVSSTLFNMIMSEILPYMNVTTADQDSYPADVSSDIIAQTATQDN